MTSEATLELLLDLKHDLGKYLSLPLSLLPKSADDAALRGALTRALQQTRTRRAGTAGGAYQSAREIWQGFAAELAHAGLAPAALAKVAAAVERALGWEHALSGERALERAAIERDFAAVQSAIAALIDEVRGG